MKKLKKLCLCIAAVLLLASCSPDSVVGGGKSVISFENMSISEGVYQYLFASIKSYYLSTYNDIKDSSDFWLSESPTGKTYESVINDEIRKAVVNTVVAAALFDKSGYTISDEDVATLDSTLDDVIESFGGRGALNRELAKFGFDDRVLSEIYRIQYKYEYMLTQSSLASADDKTIEKYYNDSYVCVKFIFFDLQRNYKYDDNGGKIVGSDGNYESVPLTSAEKDEKIKKAKELYASLSSDGDFDSEYNGQREFDTSFYPNGMYLCRDNYQSLGLDDLATEAFDMDAGEVRFVQNDACAYIVKRYELPEKAYESSVDSVQFIDLSDMCEAYYFQSVIDGYSESVIKDEEIINKYSVTNVSAVTY